MELKIDSEFRALIPPLSQEEINGLESSIVENGYNSAFPIIVWKGQEIVVDGHNRYSICQKHGLPFKTVEQEFASRYEVVAWIIKNQLARRNVNKLTRLYLIGRRLSCLLVFFY
jgi:Predicted transcriptional regulators